MRKKTKILLLTENFPFYPGEQFLEDEVACWSEETEVDLTIAPLTMRGEPRKVPDCIRVDTSLAEYNLKFKHYIKAIFSRLFFIEILDLVKAGCLSIVGLSSVVKASVRIQKTFESLMKQGEHYDVIYCYWNDVGAYAAALAKRAGKCKHLVSRAHGFDLYEDRRPGNRIPFKRQLLRYFDHVYLISEQARTYFKTVFGQAKLSVSRLGVPIVEGVSRPPPGDAIRVLSVSYCVPVKRIERIMAAVIVLARKRDDISVEWTHIGDGPLRNDLVSRAEEEMRSFSNLKIKFLGALSNQLVRQHMADESWDVMINASESEGVPVSIMEAMSYGIPAVATNVGGVAELVTSETGVLLKADASAEEIAYSIGNNLDVFKSIEFRDGCRRMVRERYNATINYKKFIRTLTADAG